MVVRNAVVSNKKVIFKDYVSGFPKESDMVVIVDENLKLKVTGDSKDILVKNLYLPCDPYMRLLMTGRSSEIFGPYTPGAISYGFIQLQL
ncbi:hypothetical protein ES319_D02G007200v1 [Gossypium barbadense]|uniref:Oxidoreductase N-terminal domain-containing protein n=2 Tax=Gossypium TaxID=3633 RepID=A0A5J5SBN8_GOSBA|nr:hypothetical protein ES319_D02G007200v1 [Gossypium barbadense]TYG77784.1 hypothetical protein ES288_D02G003100v1 [Gossypium darwinii]